MQCDRRGVLGLGFGLATLPALDAMASTGESALWGALGRGEAVAVMRHALAPGTGDPAGFRLDDCATQRNLSDEGRAQARAIGDRFRANGIDRATVRSSRWCRCLETAELLGLGAVDPLPALDSFFRARERGPAQTEAVRAFLDAWDGAVPLVLVTHQVNVTALTAVYPTSGEMVVVRSGEDGGIDVLGTIETTAA